MLMTKGSTCMGWLHMQSMVQFAGLTKTSETQAYELKAQTMISQHFLWETRQNITSKS